MFDQVRQDRRADDAGARYELPLDDSDDADG